MMRMTKDADHGVLLMSHFARYPGRLIAARELAEVVHLPQPTVTKILKLLARAQLLRSYRGLKGGYRLSRPAQEITVDEVIGALEGPIAMTQCSDHGTGCKRMPICPQQGTWQQIDRVVRGALSRVSVHDMAQQAGVDTMAAPEAKGG